MKVRKETESPESRMSETGESESSPPPPEHQLCSEEITAGLFA